MTYELTPVFGVLDRAVAYGAFPGGVLAVGLKDQLVVHPFGKLSREGKTAPVTASTIYDMASLTKVIVTTTSAMMLVQQKRLDLDAPVERYLPEFAAAAKSDPDPAWRARVTVRMYAPRLRTAGASRFLQGSQGLRCGAGEGARRAAGT